MAWARLALIQAADNPETLAKVAEVFGYSRLQEENQDGDKGVGGTEGDIGNFITTFKVETKPQRPPALFVRVNKIIRKEIERDDLQKPAYLSDPAMRLQPSSGTYRFDPPQRLMPIARLLPLLFNSLAQVKSGQTLDQKLLVQRISQGKALCRLPKSRRQRWPQRLHIIVDASRHLEPYWQDFADIVKHLQSLLGRETVDAIRLDEDSLGSERCYCSPWPPREDDRWRVWQTPPSDVAVLILSDLGVEDNRLEIQWQRQLEGLQNHPAPVLTLCPGYLAPEDSRFTQKVRPNPLNDNHAVPRHPFRRGFVLDKPNIEEIDKVLTWLSALPLIDAGLFRRLRLTMAWGDSALENLIWNHSRMKSINGLGIGLKTEFAEAYQQRFQNECVGTKEAEEFWAIITTHHANAYQGLRQLENLKQNLFEQQNDQAVIDYFQRLCATGLNASEGSNQKQELQHQCRTVLAHLPDTVWNSQLQELAYQLYAVGHEQAIRAGQWPEHLPAGFNPDRLQWVVHQPETLELQNWQLVQTGDQGEIRCLPLSLADRYTTAILKFDSPKSFPPRVGTGDAGQVMYIPQEGAALTLPFHTKTILTTNTITCELELISRPSWASRIWRDANGLWVSIPWLGQEFDLLRVSQYDGVDGDWVFPPPFGEDRFGLYVDLTYKTISQRFRWVEPGTFMMGSPRDEPEREWGGNEAGKDTEALHPVTLTQGFWLADTAVTQAFWQAVMGDNPSHFQDNWENPVEQVSWHDAQRFIDQLNGLFPGLRANLPTEAQWEYACRAGTDTPFSFGETIHPEQVNYDGNYPYNNGDKGLYREQTVPVKSLPSNPWGFYALHGNVWEWCADRWRHQMSAEAEVDPLFLDGEDNAPRVVRGGSWGNDGWNVRSAIRYRDDPDFRNGFIGFRLALGHVELRASQRKASGGDSGSRVAEQRQTEDSTFSREASTSSTFLDKIGSFLGKGKGKKK